MTKTIRGLVPGKIIQLAEDPGLEEGQEVEVQVNAISTTPRESEGLVAVYAVLGERYESGHTDTAARHDEHQP